MFRILAALVLLALGSTSARAFDYAAPAPTEGLGYCQLSVTTSVLISTCSGGIPIGADHAQIITQTQAINWRDDGTAPTTTVGMPLAVATMLDFDGTLTGLRVIAQTGTAVVNIRFYHYR